MIRKAAEVPGLHKSEARRGAARQSLHSVLYSSPAWSPEQHELNASPAALPPQQDIHPRFAQALMTTTRDAPIGIHFQS